MHEGENKRQYPLRIYLSYTFPYKNFTELKIIRDIVKKINCYKLSENKNSNKYNYHLLLANCDIEAREKKPIWIITFNTVENRSSTEFFNHTFLIKSQ